MSHQEDQRLWNNCNIMYKGKALLFPKWIEAGLCKVGQLFNGSESLCTINEISNLVGASPNLWFEYNALYNALPRQWKDKSGSPQSTSVPQFWDQNITSCINKIIREKIVSLKYSRPCSASFWEKKFKIDFERGVWNIPFKCCNETRLQFLHWKIVHNIYPSNIMLTKMKIRDSNKCQYCPSETDYIEHFFYFCTKCVTLWKHVESILSCILERRLVISAQDAILGVLHCEDSHSKELELINICILVAKMCVSKYKYGKPYHLPIMFDSEMRLRVKQLPIIYRSCFSKLIT